MLRERNNVQGARMNSSWQDNKRHEYRNARTSLFSDYNENGSGAGKTNEAHEEQVEFLERDNDRQVEELTSKVGFLKSLTVEINGEVRDHNRILDSMQTEAERTRGLLGGARSRLKRVVATATYKQMCTVVLFIVFLFFFLYYLYRWTSGSSSRELD